MPDSIGQDPNGPDKCLLCNPSVIKPIGASEHTVLIKNRVGYFKNDFPYLPGDQQVIYLWHEEENVRKNILHRFQLKDFCAQEIYWLTRGCLELGEKFTKPVRTYDLIRMVAGFNLGNLAGQSIPHFHMQYGWEVVLDRRSITKTELQLYFEELEYSDLVIFSNDLIKVIAPWTPKGQYALELYFNDKYDMAEMTDLDLKVLAVLGEKIIKKYVALGIQNVNIVFSNSPNGRKIEPLVVHFVPRVNMTALYEIRGVNVVDTPPNKIAEEFRRYNNNSDDEAINWVELYRKAEEYDPDKEFEERLTENSKSQESYDEIKDLQQ